MIQFRNTPTLARKNSRPSRGGLFRSTTAVAMLAALGLAGVAQAQQWTGAIDDDAGNPGNWTPAPPVAGDDVTVDAGADILIDGGASPLFNSGQHSSGTLTVGSTGILNVTTLTSDQQAAVQIDAGGEIVATTFGAGDSVPVTVDGTLSADTTFVSGTATLDVNSGGIVDGDVNMSGLAPTVTIDDGGELTGTATVNRGTLTNDGDIGGDVDTTGGNATVTVNIGSTGSVDGTVTHGAGSLTNSGDIFDGLSVGNGATADVTSTGIVFNGTTVGLGTINLSSGGFLIGGVTLNGGQNGGVVNSSGTITGPVVVNGGEFNTDGSIVGTVTTNGGMTNAEGTINGAVTTNGGSGFTTTGALTQTGDFTNGGALYVEGGDLTSSGGTFTNSGRIEVADGLSLAYDGSMVNSGTIGLGSGTAGSTSVILGGGGVTGSAGSTFDMENDAAGDSMTVQGTVDGTNTLNIDVDLTSTNAGFADVRTVDDDLEGTLTVSVDSIRTNAIYTLQQNGVTVAEADSFGAGLTSDMNGDLPQGPSGLVLYSLVQETDPNNPSTEQVNIYGNLNPALGSVAASMSSVQSLVTNTVNRPSGAYVSGIAFDTPGNCSSGNWARVTGGRAETESSSVTGGGLSTTSSGQLDFGGVQGGIDYGCFEAFNGGWDVSAGLLIGANQGHFAEEASGLITTGEFDQYFFGGYIAASKDNWSGELQLRHANSNYTFDNPDLDIRDEDVATDSNSISGSLTYRYDLDSNGLALLPTVGFNVTRTSTGTLLFENPLGATLGRLDFEDHTSKTGFVGTTLSRTNVNAAAQSATNTFVTATYYMDGSGSRDSTFSTSDGIATETLTTSEVGDFGELSVGGNYIRVLSATPGQVRQVNYSVRADYRFGEDVSGAGITGQMRLQF